MQPPDRPLPPLYDLLRCPVCHGGLHQSGDVLRCTETDCATSFPVVNGIPVLINEQTSVFSIDDFIARRNTTFSSPGKLEKVLRNVIPSISKNINSQYGSFCELLLSQSSAPRVLVVGGSILGQGMEVLANHPAIQLVETDVSFGPRTMLICDAHDLPFEDESFDGVIAQAVLEHVVDPYRCSEEFHRVLKKQGLIYAETPFIQQVHAGRYDFTRFTHLGHRRLFRRFEEIGSGAVCGPGMALAWSYQYFLLSFTTRRAVRGLIRLFAGLTSFFLKYVDHYLIHKPGALDAASGIYFIGRRSEQTLSDRKLISLYRGAGS